MNYWGIQKRLLLITLLPCLVIAATLGAYFSVDRFQQQHEQFRQQATLLAQQTALQAYPLFESAEQQRILKLKHYMSLPNLRSISLLNPSQQKIQHVGPIMLRQTSKLFINNETQRFETNTSVRLKAPVFSPEDELHVKLLGWVEIELNTDQQKLNQFTSLFINTLLIIGFCLVAIFIAYRTSARITRPLQEVTATLNQLESGNLNARIGLSAQTELNELATGINTMAASLQRAQQELQENVEQATEDLKETLDELEIQNIELNMARHSALEASKTKSDFLANMSHEIRTPLNGIIGFSKLLEKTRLNKRQVDYLNTIEASSSSLLSIINDILDFSKIEAGKLVLDSVPLHLRDITDEVLTMLAPEAHKKNIELAALVYQDVPYEIMGDPIRLKQVLTNLINNAIKFTESGSVIIRVMLEEELDHKVALKVTVSDTGIGLTELQQKSLFNAFSQADASTTRRFGGTGLGLVISQHLVKHMHGEIGVESVSGSGSQFWFTGTFNTCDYYQEHWNDAPWFNKVAFILSQWEFSGQVLRNQLGGLGYKVQAFTTLQELLIAQNKKAADVILMDLQHDIDDVLVQDLRRRSHVVALLTNNDNLSWDQVSTLGIKHNLVYPVSFRNLSNVSQDMFEDRRNQQPSKFQSQQINVLAVDDNGPNLELISTWLTDLHINVTRANGGLQAVQYGITQSFDLIFMDIQMPDLDGVQATQQIREQGINQMTPLVALTAHALANERKQLLSSGFDDYLTKPLSEEQLIHTLTKWTGFQSRSGQRSSDTYPNNRKQVTKMNKEINSILDWESCLSLAGGKPKLARTMAFGLLEEAEAILPILESCNDTAALLEPVHKLHGLCKYVGAQRLLAALDRAETMLKTESDDCQSIPKELANTINELLTFKMENPNWAETENSH